MSVDYLSATRRKRNRKREKWWLSERANAWKTAKWWRWMCKKATAYSSANTPVAKSESTGKNYSSCARTRSSAFWKAQRSPPIKRPKRREFSQGEKHFKCQQNRLFTAKIRA